MACIRNHCQSISSFSRLKLNRSRPSSLHQLPIRESNITLNSHNISSSHSQRTHALSNSALLLGLTSSPAPVPNITVFIVTSASLLFLYWLANFVVPNIVIKNLQSMHESEQRKSEENNIVADLEDLQKRAFDKAQEK